MQKLKMIGKVFILTPHFDLSLQKGINWQCEKNAPRVDGK